MIHKPLSDEPAKKITSQITIDEQVKSCFSDGFVKSAEIKAYETLGKPLSRVPLAVYKRYFAVTRDEAQRRYRTFYGTVTIGTGISR